MRYALLTIVALLSLAASAMADWSDRVCIVECGDNAVGSGVLVRHGGSQWVLTNAHVVEGVVKARRPSDLTVTWPSAKLTRGGTVRLYRDDNQADLAIIAVGPGQVQLDALEIAPADQFEGDGVACGFIGRQNYFQSPVKYWLASDTQNRWIGFSAVPRSGNSGGPLIDRGGKLVGILWGYNEPHNGGKANRPDILRECLDQAVDAWERERRHRTQCGPCQGGTCGPAVGGIGIGRFYGPNGGGVGIVRQRPQPRGNPYYKIAPSQQRAPQPIASKPAPIARRPLAPATRQAGCDCKPWQAEAEDRFKALQDGQAKMAELLNKLSGSTAVLAASVESNTTQINVLAKREVPDFRAIDARLEELDRKLAKAGTRRVEFYNEKGLQFSEDYEPGEPIRFRGIYAARK